MVFVDLIINIIYAIFLIAIIINGINILIGIMLYLIFTYVYKNKLIIDKVTKICCNVLKYCSIIAYSALAICAIRYGIQYIYEAIIDVFDFINNNIIKG